MRVFGENADSYEMSVVVYVGLEADGFESFGGDASFFYEFALGGRLESFAVMQFAAWERPGVAAVKRCVDKVCVGGTFAEEDLVVFYDDNSAANSDAVWREEFFGLMLTEIAEEFFTLRDGDFVFELEIFRGEVFDVRVALAC